jgi:magnesium transporter
MIFNAYRLTWDFDKPLERSEEFLKSWQQGEVNFWVDIHSYETDELESWLGNLNLSDLAIRGCREAGQATRYIPLSEEVFFEFPVYSGEASEIIHLSFLCKQNLLITLHSAPTPSLDDTIKLVFTSEMIPTELTTSVVVCVFMMLVSVQSLKISEALEKKVFDLDERMDDNPDSVEADEILNHKRSLRSLDTVVSTQLNGFEFMSRLNRPFLDLKELAAHFQFAPSNVRAAKNNVDRLEKTLADIRQRFDMNQQEKTNRRLAVLTILSAIFMPLTLIAGIYGMNFDNMPELHFPFSYPVVLIIMLLIAVGMYLYFKTRGWLD